MAPYSNILVWRIPCTEDPGWLQFRGSQSWTQLSTHVLITLYNSTVPLLIDRSIVSSSLEPNKGSPGHCFSGQWNKTTFVSEAKESFTV